MHPVAAFHRVGHFSVRTRELRALGVKPRSLAAAVHRRELVRVRVGHFALPGSDRDATAALKVGGVACCISVTPTLGLWVPPAMVPHVWLERNASRLRPPPRRHHLVQGEAEVVRHWSDLHDPIDRHRGIVSPLDALSQIVDCQPVHIAVAVLDSALRIGLLDTEGIQTVHGRVARARRWMLRELDASAQSGTESIVRTVLRRAGLQVTSQVEFAGVGFVDFMVGERVVIEVDSEAWHGGAEQQRRDYARDLELAARGAIVIRVNYSQALYDHPGIVRAVLAALATARGERFTL